eukprot:3627834-Alexandrium_andersonii.AAC.1
MAPWSAKRWPPLPARARSPTSWPATSPTTLTACPRCRPPSLRAGTTPLPASMTTRPSGPPSARIGLGTSTRLALAPLASTTSW